MSTWLQEIVLALRLLRRRPGFTVGAAAILALGIAGTATMFALAHQLLLQPLPFRDPDRLVYLDETAPRWNLDYVSIAYPDFHLWRERNRTFEAMALMRDEAFNLTSGGGSERVRAARVTHDLLGVLGVAPLLGRGFDAAEDTPGGPRVALLGHALWQRLYAGRRDVLGTTLQLDGEAVTVVGVLPPELRFPAEAELWVPLAADPQEGFGNYSYTGVGRLAPSVDVVAAKADLDAIHATLIEAHPFKEAVSAVVEPLRDRFVAEQRSTVWALLVAVTLVLLIACADVASLMLARGTTRRREMGIRAALGAGGRRLVRQLLTESLLLAALGGLAGVALAALALRALRHLLADALPFWVTLRLDPAVVGFAVVAVVATALLFGLAPAFQGRRLDLMRALYSRDAQDAGPGTRRGLELMVVFEVALAQLLLVAAGLVVLSQQRVLAVDPGFRSERVLTFQVALPELGYEEDAAREAFFARTVAALAALPGVEAAAAGTHPPLGGHTGNFFQAEGALERDPDAPTPVVLTRHVVGDYFDVLAIPLLHGRTLSPGSIEADGPREVVVNQTFARTHWGREDVAGRRIRYNGDDEPWITVVGVSRDVQHYGLEQEMRPGVYLPVRRDAAPGTLTFVVHTAGEPTAAVADARRAVAAIDPTLPLFQVETMEDRLAEALTLRRLTTSLFGLFATVALLLAAAGAYGVLSFAVGRRRREMAMRLALGARRAQVLRLVLGRGLVLAAVGAALGLGAALAAGGALESLLYGVEPRDPAVLAAVTAALGLVAAVAAIVPALRAARLEPMRILRED